VLNWFFANILHDGFGRSTSNRHDSPRLLILTPPATDAPHSSLVHMFDTLRRAMEQPSNVFYGTLASDGGWQIDFPAVAQSLTKIKSENNPCFLLGTAFSFVHLLEYLEQHPFCLPAGSRVLETGGYKGRSRSLEKHELHSWIQKNLGVEQANIIGEYGMSELSSQAYDLVENNKSKSTALPMRVFHFPPWAQVQIISPETGDEVGEGETGLVRVFDLANTYSVMAIQTEDLAIRRGNGFELLGRAAAAEARGCSLMAT